MYFVQVIELQDFSVIKSFFFPLNDLNFFLFSFRFVDSFARNHSHSFIYRVVAEVGFF